MVRLCVCVSGIGGTSSNLHSLSVPFHPPHPTGPFNSWNRQVYVWDGDDGQPTVWKKNDTISYNFILANYHSR